MQDARMHGSKDNLGKVAVRRGQHKERCGVCRTVLGEIPCAAHPFPLVGGPGFLDMGDSKATATVLQYKVDA